MSVFSSPQRSSRSHIHPLLTSILIFSGGVALFFLVKGLFFGTSGESIDPTISIPRGNTVYIRLSNESKFDPVSTSSLKILEGEVLQSRNTANSSISFFEGSQIFLDTNTHLEIQKSRKHKGDAREIRLQLSAGQIWASIRPQFNPLSVFEIQLSERIFLTSQNGSFTINSNESLLKVSEGSVRIAQKENGKETFYKDIGIGQQFSFAGDLTNNSIAIVQQDDWFAAHATGNFTTSPETPSESDTTSPLSPQDTISPQSIQILVPGKNGEKVFIDSEPQQISGTVPVGTTKVVINTYALQRFKAGDTNFSYTAALQYSNLQEGENEYTVQAYKDTEVISTANIILVYDPEGNSQESSLPSTQGTTSLLSTQDTVVPSSTTQEVTGIFALTAPNDGNDYTAPNRDGIDITGTAPSNAQKIVVNGYTLSRFTAGDTSWIYKVRNEFGNMKAGNNTYEIKAYDQQDKVVGQAFITITFPEPENTSSPRDETTKESEDL